MSRHDPMVYIHHMFDHATEARDMTRNRSRDDLDTDRMLNLSLVRLMEVVSDVSRRVPADFRSRYPHVPWHQTSDLHNLLIHAYDEIDFDTLWLIIQNEILPLIEQLETILADEGK